MQGVATSSPRTQRPSGGKGGGGGGRGAGGRGGGGGGKVEEEGRRTKLIKPRGEREREKRRELKRMRESV